MAQTVEVEGEGLDSLCYHVSDLGGDHVAVGLGSGEGGFGVDAAVDVGFIVEDLLLSVNYTGGAPG